MFTALVIAAWIGAWVPAAQETAQDPGPAERDSRPNIVFLLSDDHAASVLGCYGHPWVATPNLDRIAAEGVRFENAFVTISLCSPARASYLTGQYVRRHGLLRNGGRLAPDAVTFASALTAAGYDSAYIGKWHVGPPTGAGFGYSASFEDQGSYNGAKFQFRGKRSRDRYVTGWVDDSSTDFAIRFLREERERPFLLCVGFKSVHTPWVPPARADGRYADVEIPAPPSAGSLPPFPTQKESTVLQRAVSRASGRTDVTEDWLDEWQGERLPDNVGAAKSRAGGAVDEMREYFAIVSALDDNVGRILDALDELELADDTLVVYATDNGISLGEHGIMGKRHAYEECIKTPLIVRYPKLKAQGVVRDELVLNLDVAPTLLDFAGVPVPDSMQGTSLRPLLDGDSVPWRDAFLYEFFNGPHRSPAWWCAVRTEEWKLVRYPGFDSWTQLFDLEADPLEMRNLAFDPERAGILEQLTQQLDELDASAGPRPAGFQL